MSKWQKIIEWEMGYWRGTKWLPELLRLGVVGRLDGYLAESYRRVATTNRAKGFMAGHVAVLVGVDLSMCAS